MKNFNAIRLAAIQLWLDGEPVDGYRIDLYHTDDMTSFTVYGEKGREENADFFLSDMSTSAWARALAKLCSYLKEDETE